MRRLRFAIVSMCLIAAGVAANLPARVSKAAPQGEVQTLTITSTLQNAGGGEAGDLMTTFKSGELTGVSFKSHQIRHRMFAIIDRTHASAVSCDPKDAEYGAVKREDGSWLAVAKCPKGTSTTALAIPALIRARAAADQDTAMTCWENKELQMGVCYKVGTKPPTQTREHILLARQVGVPH